MALNFGETLGAGLIGKALDFGFGAASGKMYEKQVRELRRSEYQDMVHSLKQAGLNPMLAMGATPGHSAAFMMQQGNANLGSTLAGLNSADAAGRQAGVAEKKADPEIDKIREEARRTKGLITNDQWARATMDANIKRTNQETLTSAAQMALFNAKALESGASAKQIAAQEANLRADLPNIQSGFGAGWQRGALRELGTERFFKKSPGEHGADAAEKVRENLGRYINSAKESNYWKNFKGIW